MSFEGPGRQSPQYRPEIDGLRAIAVLAVMLYHARFAAFGGGYVGVDVFFVISGYLITNIILREKAEGRFSLAGFYERRMRRILPALFTVLTACLLPAALFLDPVALQAFGASLAASAGFAANIHFWQGGGSYFSFPVDRMPLLHLWSLAVEEQFYLLYPAALLLVWRFARRWLPVAIAAALMLSLALSEFASVYRPAANFYLLPTRGWELLAGASVSLFERRRAGGIALPPWLADAAALAGLAMIAATVAVYDDHTRFPGLSALWPVIGTALVIAFARGGTRAARLLAAPLLVGIGLLSYSAYLWHQPLLALTRSIAFDAVTPAAAALLLIAAFVLAYFTWRIVETPFRRSDFLRRRTIFILSAAVGAALVAAGAWLWASAGLPDRLDADGRRMAGMNPVYAAAIQPCFFVADEARALESGCVRGNRGEIGVAILGDSHAVALAPGLDPLLARHERKALLLTAAGCPPVLDADVLHDDQRHCAPLNRRALDWLARRPDIRVVVLHARWSYYIERAYFDNGEGGVEAGPVEAPPPASLRSATADAYRAMADRLLAMGKTVVLVYPVPEPGWDVPLYLVKAQLRGRALPGPLSTSQRRFETRNRLAYTALDGLGDHPGLVRVYPADAFCGAPMAGRCVLNRGAVPYYFDDDHLSVEGARRVLGTLDLSRRGS